MTLFHFFPFRGFPCGGNGLRGRHAVPPPQQLSALHTRFREPGPFVILACQASGHNPS